MIEYSFEGSLPRLKSMVEGQSKTPYIMETVLVVQTSLASSPGFLNSIPKRGLMRALRNVTVPLHRSTNIERVQNMHIF